MWPFGKDKIESPLQKVCIAFFCIIGNLLIFWWRVLPMPYSPAGRPINVLSTLAVLGYTYLFAMIGTLVGGGLEHIYKTIICKIFRRV